MIIVPEIERVALDLPTIRFSDIDSQVALRYSLYDGQGKFVSSSSIVGHGGKTLVFRKENYVIAFQEAIKDLLKETNTYLRSQSK